MQNNTRQLTLELILADQLSQHTVIDINQASKRIYLRTMDFDAQSSMLPIIDSLARAADRGLDTTLVYDPIAHYSPHQSSLRRAVEQLEVAGVAIINVGQPLHWYLPHAGRSHSKGYLIDDVTYIGGVNLTGRSFNLYDYMLRTEDIDFNACIQTILRDSEASSAQPDKMVRFDDETKVYVDGGKRGSSIIMDRAVELTKGAIQAWYVSQFAPGRKLAAALATLNDDALIKFNTPHSNRSRNGRFAASVESITARHVRNQYRGGRKIHAKLLIVQQPDNRYVAFTGSHNLSDWGVRLGTKEIMLESHDQNLCRQLIDYAENTVI